MNSTSFVLIFHNSHRKKESYYCSFVKPVFKKEDLVNTLVPLLALLFIALVYAAVRVEQSRRTGRTKILAFIVIPIVLIVLSLIITDGRFYKQRTFKIQNFIVLRSG